MERHLRYGSIHSALTLSRWALDAVLLPPLLIMFTFAAVGVLWATWRRRPLQSQDWRSHYWGVLTQLLFFAAAIAVGVVRAVPLSGSPSSRHPDYAGKVCLEILLYLSLATGVFWIWKMKAFRWFATGLVVLMQMPVLGAIFVAGMSVTGDWL